MKGINKRRILILITAAVVLAAGIYFFTRPGETAALPASAANTDTNLLVNGNFEKVDEDGLPSGWYTDYYIDWEWQDQPEPIFEVTENGASIHNPAALDARFAQQVSVEPDAVYCLKGKIRANAQGGLGANLSVDGVYAFSPSVFQAEDEWQEVALYGRTGTEQTSVIVYARLGGYGGESTGHALFQDLSFTRISQVPDGEMVHNFFIPQPFLEDNAPEGNESNSNLPSYSPHSGNPERNEYNKNAANLLTETASSLILSVSLLFVLFFLGVKDRLSPLPALNEKQPSLHWLWLAGVLVLVFVLRVYAAQKVPGYDVDIGCFTHWANTMATWGPAQFYNKAGFCDYPPGYMNVLWLVGLVGQFTGGVTELMVKMPSILSDILICLVLYLEGKKRTDHRNALLLSAFWAFNPVSFAAGACWGQSDSLMTLLLLLSVLFIFKNQWKIALPVYVAAVLVKPQALMFGPMGVAALILYLKNNKFDKKIWMDLLIGMGISIAVFCALALPFIVQISPAVYLNAKGFEDYQITAMLDRIAADPSITEMEGYTLNGGIWANLANGIKFIFSLYGNTMGHYAYATINACNVYFLLNLNWVSVTGKASMFTGFLVLFIATLPAVIGTLRSGKSAREHTAFFYVAGLFLAGVITLVVMYTNGGVPYETLGTLMIVYICALCIGLFLMRGEMSMLPVFAAAMLMLLFSCGTMMHERYLLPAIILLLLGFITTKDKRLLYLMVLTTLASFINISCVLDRNIRIGGVEAHLSIPSLHQESDMYILEYFSGGLTTLASMLCLYLAVSPKRQYTLPEEKPLPPFKIHKRDVVIMLVGTVLYAVLAFVNLGATVSPQTAWTANNYKTETYNLVDTPESRLLLEHTEPDDSIQTQEHTVYEPETLTLDLGEERQFTIQFMAGIHYYMDASFTIESGNENAFWDLRHCTATEGSCFQWQDAADTRYAPMTGRYVRITAEDDKLMLFEILFRDAESGEIIPATLAESSNNNPTARNICDEPDTMAGDVPSWYNSTYFDEIYHARTAYEHLHGMRTYETSHPPLGKVLMSWAIAIFGMTPFGWRFAGALAGVMMLPGMYLLAKMLCRNKWAGLFAMLMMAFDTMHFTQTRIATIDSFVVLFIIWAVYFMLYWFRMDFFEKPFWKTLLPLFFSGVFMGLSIASKWTGVYNIIALAVIFFWGFMRRLQEWLAARKEAAQYEQKLHNTQANANRKKGTTTTAPEKALHVSKKGFMLWATIALCIIFFIVIPLTIYYLSYIPYFAYDGGVTVEKVIHAAVGNYLETGELNNYDGMLGYHSQQGLGMDHDYYSPWYEWPVIAEPMYYYHHSHGTENATSTIMLLGNPGVWWVCLVGLTGIAVIAIYRHMRYDVYKYQHPGAALRQDTFHFTQPWDFRYGLLILCFLVQFMPWVLVPRGTYIYHYFTSIPFIILCTAVCLDKMQERWPRKTLVLGAVILLTALALFIGFFPYASGVTVSRQWLESMQWFDRWIYF
ncbi:MAG: glycosyltransferase family 39 protein [Clostridia bacterium]|nr:glycosyltransferase family 39 protein [Clostridia bacterium]